MTNTRFYVDSIYNHNQHNSGLLPYEPEIHKDDYPLSRLSEIIQDERRKLAEEYLYQSHDSESKLPTLKPRPQRGDPGRKLVGLPYQIEI